MKRLKKAMALLLAGSLVVSVFSGCGGNTSQSNDKKLGNLKFEKELEIKHASQFKVDVYEGGYYYITTAEKDKCLVVPEGGKEPEGLPKDVTVLHGTTDKMYLQATPAMAFFNAINAIDKLSFVGNANPDYWYIPAASEAMKSGKLVFAGKYSEPDYELLLKNECKLTIASTMITHTPEVKDKLEELGIPVFMDLSSREADPLGRLEWVKVYGILTGKYNEAESFYNTEAAKVDKLANEKIEEKTVAFFSINSAGLAVVRKSKDYVPRMIEIAGGKYIFSNLGDDTDALSTVNMSLEEFYQQAVNADVIIYNSTIEGEIKSAKDLVDKSEIFKDFKAVKEGNVWCTSQNMYQATDAMADIIVDMRAVISGNEDGIKNLKYISKLN